MDVNGWDGRDYKLWGKLQSLPHYGLVAGKPDNPMVARKDVIALLEKTAEERFNALHKSAIIAANKEREDAWRAEVANLKQQLAQAQANLAAARERDQEVLKRWIVDANEGRIKFGTRELTNDELALIGDALRCVAADMKAAELKGEQP